MLLRIGSQQHLILLVYFEPHQTLFLSHMETPVLLSVKYCSVCPHFRRSDHLFVTLEVMVRRLHFWVMGSMVELAANFVKTHCLLVVVWEQHLFQAQSGVVALKQSKLFALMHASIHLQIVVVVVVPVSEFLISK